MKEVDLRMLAERGVGFNASVLTVPCGYVLQLETGKGLEVLRLQRGGERVFKTLDAVAALLGAVGITSFSVELQSSVSLPPLIEVPAILDPLCSNPRDYNHGGLPPLVPAIEKSVIPKCNNAVTPPPDERERDVSRDARDERTGDNTPRDSTRSRELLLDAGMNPLEKAKADPKRAKARANRKKRR